MAKRKVLTGMGNEPFYMSRRVWAAALTLVATCVVGFAPESYDLVVVLAGFVASTLGITSWVKPAK